MCTVELQWLPPYAIYGSLREAPLVWQRQRQRHRHRHQLAQTKHEPKTHTRSTAPEDIDCNKLDNLYKIVYTNNTYWFIPV